MVISLKKWFVHPAFLIIYFLYTVAELTNYFRLFFAFHTAYTMKCVYLDLYAIEYISAVEFGITNPNC